MAEGDMSAERPNPHQNQNPEDSGADSNSAPQDPLRSSNADKPGFLGRFLHHKDEPNPEDLLRADIERIRTLREINEDLKRSQFNASNHPPLDITAWNADTILETYNVLSPDKRKRQRKGYAEYSLGAIRNTKELLIGDLNTLYLDRGATPLEAVNETDALTSLVVKGKKRDFGQLGKDAQISLLENISQKRAAMLRENWGDYIYFLSNDRDALDLTEADIQKMKYDYSIADAKTQTKLAAEARRKALAAMDITKKVNLDRLIELDRISGKPEKQIKEEADEIRARYMAGSIPEKDRIIEDILRRKTKLGIKHIAEIIKLRLVLQDKQSDIESQSQTAEIETPTEEDLLREVGLVNEFIEREVRSHINSGIHRNIRPSDASTQDAQSIVNEIAGEHKDPTLSVAYRVVESLRTTANDSLNI